MMGRDGDPAYFINMCFVPFAGYRGFSGFSAWVEMPGPPIRNWLAKEDK
jgi:hypothetical protein